MRPARLALTTLVGALSVGILVAGGGTSTAAETHPLCRSREAIPVQALAQGVRRVDCDLTGRVIDGGEVRAGVPPEGLVVHAEAYVPQGEEPVPTLVVSHEDGVVTARQQQSPAETYTDARTTDRAPSNGCLQNTAANPFRNRWREVWNWYFQMSSTPSRYQKLVVEHHVKTAAINVAAGHNDCGLRGDPQLSQRYRGRTAQSPNMFISGGVPACSSRTNRANVMGWKRWSGRPLGVACYWTYAANPGRTYASDVLLDSDNGAIVQSFTAGCRYQFDIQSILTHEFGHSAGFDHAPNETYTMDDDAFPCSYYARTFARNEWYGLTRKYGVR